MPPILGILLSPIWMRIMNGIRDKTVCVNSPVLVYEHSLVSPGAHIVGEDITHFYRLPEARVRADAILSETNEKETGISKVGSQITISGKADQFPASGSAGFLTLDLAHLRDKDHADHH
jgi:hypothetical protein